MKPHNGRMKIRLRLLEACLERPLVKGAACPGEHLQMYELGLVAPVALEQVAQRCSRSSHDQHINNTLDVLQEPCYYQYTAHCAPIKFAKLVTLPSACISAAYARSHALTRPCPKLMHVRYLQPFLRRLLLSLRHTNSTLRCCFCGCTTGLSAVLVVEAVRPAASTFLGTDRPLGQVDLGSFLPSTSALSDNSRKCEAINEMGELTSNNVQTSMPASPSEPSIHSQLRSRV